MALGNKVPVVVTADAATELIATWFFDISTGRVATQTVARTADWGITGRKTRSMLPTQAAGVAPGGRKEGRVGRATGTTGVDWGG